MKKELLLLAVAALLAAGAQAQTNWGLKAGVTMPKINHGVKVLGLGISADSPESHLSFYVTGFADITLSEKFSFQPGLSYQGKGEKRTDTEDGVKTKETTNLGYLEVPINVVYYIKAGAGKIFLGAGPYAAYGITGKEKMGKESEKIKWGKNKDLKPLDFGLNTMWGYKLSGGVIINMGYGMGFANMMPKGNEELVGLTSKNRVLSAGIGFQF